MPFVLDRVAEYSTHVRPREKCANAGDFSVLVTQLRLIQRLDINEYSLSTITTKGSYPIAVAAAYPGVYE